MVRSSFLTIRCTSAAISGGIEKVMTFDLLGVVIFSLLPLIVLRCHTSIMNGQGSRCQGAQPL